MPGHQYISIPEPESIPLPDDIPLPLPTPPAATTESSTQILDLSEIELPPIAPPPEEVPSKPASNEHQANQTNPGAPTTSHFEQKKQRRKRISRYREEEDSLCTSVLREEQDMMAKMMGFSKFDSTKGKQVPGNQVGAVHVVKKRRYRQYMNRKGGFNRPLDKVA